MAYDRATSARSSSSLGFGGAPVDLSAADFVVPSTVKALVLTAAGNVVVRPVNGSVDITLTALPAGYVLPWHCSHVRKTGTTASLATVLG